MVLLKQNDEDLYIICEDNIIRYNIKGSNDICIKIPKVDAPKNLQQDPVEATHKERKITCLEFSPSGKYFCVTVENKQVIIYDKNLKIIKSVLVNRAPSKACFTASDDLIIADKTGDVYLYKLEEEENKPILLLGHLSVVLDVIISQCGKYIITSDRDEKIRVSHFPNCYNIASYCLGHTEFVNKISLINNVLISASGDGTVRFWDFIKGKQIGIIDTNLDMEKKNLLEVFSEQMNKEKVEILALPIIDMHVHLGEVLYIAVSIYNYDCIHLYQADFSNFSTTLINKFKIGSTFSFCLSNDLYVFNNNFSKFKLTDTFLKQDDANLNKLYEKYGSLLKCVDNSSVTVFYKRRFDNVQEYLERKKQRL